jgi:hypothetical protein
VSDKSTRKSPGRPLTPDEVEVARGLASRRSAALLLVEASTGEIREWLADMGEVSRPALARALGVDRATVDRWAEK